MTKADKWLIISLLIVAFAFILGRQFVSILNNQKATAEIKVKGRVVQELLLTGNDNSKEYSVHGPLGVSTFEVRGNKIKMLSSPCPDKICIKQGWIENDKQAIICVPNQVSITLKQKSELDEITQ